jgi:hypothetical protein
MANLIEVLKQTALDAVNSQNPTSIIYGKVLSAEPLTIQVNSKLTLDDTFLVLTKNVSDYEAEIDIDYTGDGEIEIEGVAGNLLKQLSISGAKITIHNALKAGDEVVMIQMQGGQKYVVLDKIGR